MHKIKIMIFTILNNNTNLNRGRMCGIIAMLRIDTKDYGAVTVRRVGLSMTNRSIAVSPIESPVSLFKNIFI